MKQKKIETLLYSAIGVVVMFLVIVAVNLISQSFKARLDLTEGGLYTLSPGTKAILKKVDSPVEIRFYFSQSEARIPSQLRTYASEVEDLLEEFRQASGGKIRVRKIDPKPDSDAEEAAQIDGIEGQPMGPMGDRFYFGLTISLDPEKAVVPLQLERERLLEYDIAHALGQVISTNKPVLGIMTPLPMFGQPMNPMMMRMGQQGQRPWVFIQELKRDYNVKQVPMEVDKIDADIQVLVVAHPKNISDKAQFAIDQFLLRGGKLLAFLDATSFFDREQQQPNNPLAGMMPSAGSSLPKLLPTWGVGFDMSKVVADLSFTKTLALSQREQPQPHPTFLFITPDGINKEDALTSQLDNLLLIEAGAFTGAPATGLEQSVLLHTTKKSELVEGMTARMQPQKTMNDFKASGTEHPLAIRLKGKFKTSFPAGRPAEPPAEGEKKDEKKPADDSLKESKTETVVMLVGDVDFLNDSAAFDPQMLQMGIANPANGNFAFAISMIEQLSGDLNLVGTRSRGTLRRPFTVVQKMQAEAQEEFQGIIQKLNAEREATQAKLRELQGKKTPGQRQIISPEQEVEIKKHEKREREISREIRETNKRLRERTESLENKTKLVNIAGVPLLVAFTGLALALLRKQRTKAQ